METIGKFGKACGWAYLVNPARRDVTELRLCFMESPCVGNAYAWCITVVNDSFIDNNRSYVLVRFYCALDYCCNCYRGGVYCCYCYCFVCVVLL